MGKRKRSTLKYIVGNIALGFNAGSTILETTKIANKLLVKSLAKSKVAISTSLNGIKKISTKAGRLLQKLKIPAQGAKFAKGGFASVTSALNIVMGFWDIFEG